jgi:hypothetical protein
MKHLRNSAMTKAVREKHIEINRKTLECRNKQVERVLGEKKGKNE